MRNSAVILSVMVLLCVAALPSLAAQELWASDQPEQPDKVIAVQTAEEPIEQVPLDADERERGVTYDADSDVREEYGPDADAGTEFGRDDNVGLEAGEGAGDQGVEIERGSSDEFGDGTAEGSGGYDWGREEDGVGGTAESYDADPYLEDGFTDVYGTEGSADANEDFGEYGDGGAVAEPMRVDEIGLSPQLRSEVDQIDRAGKASLERVLMEPSQQTVAVLRAVNDQAIRELSFLAEVARAEGSEQTAGAAEALLGRRQERYSEMMGQVNTLIRQEQLRDMGGGDSWQEQRREELKRRRRQQEEMQRQGGYEIYNY